MTPTATTEKVTTRTTKRGLSLETFDDVLLYKEVPIVRAPTSLHEAEQMVGNDMATLLKIVHEGLQARAVEQAREQSEGWLVMPENGTPSSNDSAFTGQLANPEDVNPIVLQFAKLMFGYDDIKSTDPDSADKKRKAKDAAREQIKSMPNILQALQKKATQSAPAGE